jgi:transcriptional regulator with XRE-family HTH domain/ribosomal protein L37E
LDRLVVRCVRCRLRQFLTRSLLCRRCSFPLQYSREYIETVLAELHTRKQKKRTSTAAQWIAFNLGFLREHHGLTQRQMAAMMGISRRHYVALEKSDISNLRATAIVRMISNLRLPASVFAIMCQRPLRPHDLLAASDHGRQLLRILGTLAPPARYASLRHLVSFMELKANRTDGTTAAGAEHLVAVNTAVGSNRMKPVAAARGTDVEAVIPSRSAHRATSAPHPPRVPL